MTIYDACEKLNKLAERRGPAGVARAMRLTGCKGRPQNPADCVIAEYLGKKCPSIKGGLEVDGVRALWTPKMDGPLTPDRIGGYCFGDNLASFIGNFDAGDYPELEAKP